MTRRGRGGGWLAKLARRVCVSVCFSSFSLVIFVFIAGTPPLRFVVHFFLHAKPFLTLTNSICVFMTRLCRTPIFSASLSPRIHNPPLLCIHKFPPFWHIARVPFCMFIGLYKLPGLLLRSLSRTGDVRYGCTEQDLRISLSLQPSTPLHSSSFSSGSIKARDFIFPELRRQRREGGYLFYREEKSPPLRPRKRSTRTRSRAKPLITRTPIKTNPLIA